MKIAISSGHGLYIRGAAGPSPWGLDEVDEARRVVPSVAEFLRLVGNDVVEFHDNTSTTQDQNLKAITNWHNRQFDGTGGDLAVSVHFNAYYPTSGAMGTECLWTPSDSTYTEELSREITSAISSVSGLPNRGPKKRTDLWFLNKTLAPAILIETCFCDAAIDCEIYNTHFEAICEAVANTISPTPGEEADLTKLHKIGRVSWFGGPTDYGVASDEGLALEAEGCNPDDRPELFLSESPPGTTGNARRLNANEVRYLAMRWDYDIFSKQMLASGDYLARIRSNKTGKEVLAFPVDWGPNSNTGRVCDVSPKIMSELSLETDDEVTVDFPVPG